MTRWSVTMTASMSARLHNHLFQADRGEHGAVIGASRVETARGTRLLARRLWLAQDGIDYVPGRYGHRMLTADFVGDRITDCEEAGLVYLAVHCHGGTTSVAFSPTDMQSHERGYPALLDIIGNPVGALVFATSAVAGDIWTVDGDRSSLAELRVLDRPIRSLHHTPPTHSGSVAEIDDRQSRLFGARGQEILSNQKVAIIGVGGAGSLVNEYLARLGVGHIVAIDPDRIETSNLPRVVGARRLDALTWFTAEDRPAWLRRLAVRFATPKVNVARRVARQARPDIIFTAVRGDITDAAVAAQLRDCDYLFLAADSMQARLVFNAIVHQYLIPGVQVGAKVSVDPKSGVVTDIFSVVRPITPDDGCLYCNGLIPPAKLQEEAISPTDRARQRYVDDPEVIAPSVITLNAVAAAHAVDDYLFAVTGFTSEDGLTYKRYLSTEGDLEMISPRKDPNCRECSFFGRLAAGDHARLPTRMVI